jgi:hypothetical protein
MAFRVPRRLPLLCAVLVQNLSVVGAHELPLFDFLAQHHPKPFAVAQACQRQQRAHPLLAVVEAFTAHPLVLGLCKQGLLLCGRARGSRGPSVGSGTGRALAEGEASGDELGVALKVNSNQQTAKEKKRHAGVSDEKEA